MTRFDVEKALQFIALDDSGHPKTRWPGGAEPGEYLRSPAACSVARMAADAGLFAFHFEHRHRLAIPDAWCAGRSPVAPTWTGGVLPESKYQSFRHDHAVASFHPGHRAKWGTHELCHALVGFAWSPTATPLFHATAARLSELLPVALWYFFDEARLTRCPRHADGGALFREVCLDCEAAAGPWQAAVAGERWVRDGLQFVESELAAVDATRRSGQPVPHRWATLNLCSDGLAYADGHGDRLSSRSFAMWIERFAVAGGGWHVDLDDLVERVMSVCMGIAAGAPVAPLVPSRQEGTERWRRQDLGCRLLQVWEDCEGDCADSLLTIVDELAAGCPISQTLQAYVALHEDWVIPDPHPVFAVGYPLPGGFGSDLDQLQAGVASALPSTATALGTSLPEQVAAFAADDVWTRQGIGRRFAAWLARNATEELASIAHYEAAVTHALPARVQEVRCLGPGMGPHRLTTGVELLRLAQRPDGGPGPLNALVAKDRGDVLLVELTEEDASRLEGGASVPAALVDELSQLGLVSPSRWPVYDGVQGEG